MPAPLVLGAALGTELQNVQRQDNTLSFKLGSAEVILGLMPGPIPWEDLEDPCKTSRLWPDATQVLRPHTAHLVVSVRGDLDPLMRIVKLTQVTAAVIANIPTLGVFWYDSRLVVPPQLFNQMAAVVHEEPLCALWIDFRVAPLAEGGSAGFTRGLEALGHMELEAPRCPEPATELGARFVSIAEYLIASGPVIQDGDTIGESADEKIRVVYSPSAFGNPARVMQLQYGA